MLRKNVPIFSSNFYPKSGRDEAVLERAQYTLDFITSFKQNHGGNSPSLREIIKGCGFSSTSHAAQYLKKLVGFGFIEVESGARMITVRGWEFRRIIEDAIEDADLPNNAEEILEEVEKLRGSRPNWPY